MGIVFNADEVFEMAEKIEENGAAFYRRAAELQAGEKSEFLLGLAEMEDQHKLTFAAMRSELSDRMKEETPFDPYMEASLYLNAAATAHGGEGAPSAADSLNGGETLAEVLRISIGLEQQSIVFYLGVRDMVPERFGRDKVDAIIGEERGHIVTLVNKLKEVQG